MFVIEQVKQCFSPEEWRDLKVCIVIAVSGFAVFTGMLFGMGV